MKKISLYIFLILFLSSCGDNPGEKRRKTECEKAGLKKGSSYEACIENDDSTFLYTLDFAIDEKIKEIKEYNLKVEKFNKIVMGINKDEYERVNIDSFLSNNHIKNKSGLGFELSSDAQRKKIKFNSYFEINNNEYATRSYYIRFSSLLDNMRVFKEMFEVKKGEVKQREVKDITEIGGAFQNIEIERKTIDELVGPYTYQLSSPGFLVPIGDTQSTFYGYFLSEENKILENYSWSDSLFYIEDIELKTISTDRSNIQTHLVNQRKKLAALSEK